MNKQYFLTIFVLIALLYTPPNAFAVEMKQLFNVSVGVSTQQQSEREQAMKTGFSQVLVRVSGSASVANEPSMYDALQNAQRYVLGFSYGKYEK
ncbi:MAG: DUF2066 domain-containing protein, partial [Gammaproteobacteria bacterium]|nr:DUF2066 domain-containing protein [Gammaproteobacteria bacterium]